MALPPPVAHHRGESVRYKIGAGWFKAWASTSRLPAAIQTAVSYALSVRVYNRDANTCVYCGASGVPINVDHVGPQAHYPAAAPTATVNAWRNLVTACFTCNSAKGPQPRRVGPDAPAPAG